MISTDHSAAPTYARWLPLALGRVIAGARNALRQHPILIAAAAVVGVGGGGAAGVAATRTSSSAVQPAAACGGWTGYYAYAVPEDPAHPPAAGGGATSWGWMPRRPALKVGNRIRLRPDGPLWQITRIAAMPGVEPLCHAFGIVGWPLAGQQISGNTSMVLGGRLIVRPAN